MFDNKRQKDCLWKQRTHYIKIGSLSNVENYRMLHYFGKLFTRLTNNKLTAWTVKYNVYIEAQAGFRSELGTIDRPVRSDYGMA